MSLIFLFFLALLFPPSLLATTLESDSYQILLGNLNTTSGNKTSTNYSLSDTVGQTAASLFSGTGYYVKAGFQYLNALYPFSFAISDLTIDFGSLSSSTLLTRTNTLSVTAPSSGYSVTALAAHRLQSGNNYIPHTSCNTTCSTTLAGIWDSSTAYGFGYNASGDDIASDFSDSTYFRPFPDLAMGGSPAIVLTTTKAGKNREAVITYQVNIEGDQPPGDYSTSIIYTATPAY